MRVDGGWFGFRFFELEVAAGDVLLNMFETFYFEIINHKNSRERSWVLFPQPASVVASHGAVVE